MKKLITRTIAIVFFMSFMGCSEEYFDVNTPTGTATVDQLGMNDLLGPVIYHTVNAQYWAERSFGNYSQYFTGQGGGAIGQTSISSTWSRVYLYALPNLKTIIAKAEEKNAPHFAAVAEILIAINLGLAADSWDNIPYSEASQGTANPQPAFDTQESIYNNIDSLLASAIAALEGPDSSGFAPNSSSDLIYDGDLDKWLRAAYTIRARYQLHLTEQNGTAAASAALASLANGFSSNSDDFQMFYTEKNINPWYSRQILAANTGNAHDKLGDQLVSYMNGTSYPYNSISLDPRLPIYGDKDDGGAGDPWRGYVSGGDGLSSDGESGNTDFADGGFYTNAAAPLVVISYAEAMFIKAEAEFLVNGGNETSVGSNTAAYTAYMDGITASMNKLGADGTDYLADTSIDLGEGSIMLQHIMKEKYIANFLNPETFVDLRRHDFSSNVFKDLSLPADNADGEYPGQWFVRAQYPSSEATRNPDNVIANSQEPITKVWWDQ